MAASIACAFVVNLRTRDRTPFYYPYNSGICGWSGGSGEQRSMSLFKTYAELTQEIRYPRSKTSGFNVSSVYVLKTDMDLCSSVDAVPAIDHRESNRSSTVLMPRPNSIYYHTEQPNHYTVFSNPFTIK